MVKMGVATMSRSQRRDDIGSEKEGNNGNTIQKRSVGRPRKTLDQFVERGERGQRTGTTSRSKSTNDLLLTSSRDKSGSDPISSSRSGGGGRKKNVIRESDEDDDDEDQIGDRSIPIRRQSSQRKNASGSAAKTDGRRKSLSSSSQASSKQRGRKSKGDDQKVKKGLRALGAEEEEEEEDTRSTSPSPQRPSTEAEIQKRIEEENALMERWQEEYFEIVEQLPLELRRTYTLMRELETKFQDKIDLIAFDAKEYQNARKAYANLTEEQKEIQAKIQRQLERQAAEEQKVSTIQHQGQNLPTVEEEEVLLSSEADGEFEDDVEIFHELSGEPVKSETSPSSALRSLSSSEPEQQEIIQRDESPSDLAISTDIAIDSPISSSVIENFAELAPTKSSRLLLLSKIAKSSSESIRIAEEKVGLAVTAYEWVDRQIRRLDADLQKSENTLLLGLRAGTEASRGLQDALGIDYQNGQSAHRWDDIEALLMGRSTVQRQQQEQQQTTTTRKRRQGKGKDEGQSSNSENDEEKTIILPNNTNEMAIDPNEPTYCYCDEVSSGEMIACDNEDCPREWFHLNCVGFDQPPKGKWFCLFCAIENNFKGSGSFPNNAPCLPSHLQSFTTSNGKNRKGGGKRKRVYSSAATANLSLINKNKQQRRK